MYHLNKFRAKLPNNRLYDLSCNVNKRKRTELASDVLPCLTTSSMLWLPGGNCL